MQFWQSLFLTEGDQILDVTKICDGLGFHGMLFPDHLIHPEKQDSTYLYSADGKPPSFTEDTVWPECWSLFATLAAMTKNLHFCTCVFILPLRNPIELAKATSSVAYFSNGRIHLGAGAGWMKEEFEMLGVDWATRGKRYDECIEVMRKLYTGQYVEHHGEFFDFPRIMMTPVPEKPVPILIGGISGPALRRAARIGDGWIGPGQSVDAALQTLSTLNKLRTEYGTQNKEFNNIVPIYGDVSIDDIKRLEDAGATGMVSLPFAFTIKPGTTLEEKRAYLERYSQEVIAKFR
ncbi:TIGR03619 family F420-dependent LLM class oxidoreductase [Denitratisoma sp. DHT3]|uniref:TIGR03619 family F420-dependent LLM class oxidoreductase n=1 Tax=Denitratisoma sp. DHT3 TaxID=1981880 RepID=UPI001648DA2D|nr:TIGR03619 family F420-dependent LLM class oxidoreductase [Denitratisoma sp. DHT3]